MRLHPLVAAVLALVSASASAQSSVTLFGVVDAALSVGKGSIADRTRLVSGAMQSSRLGFRGTEDLGAGLAASFHLEAGLNTDDGTMGSTNTNNQASGTGTAAAGTQGLTFNRRSTVSLSGGMGELRLGRDYDPQFWNLTTFDPFGSVGSGLSLTNTNAYGANPIGAGGPYARGGGVNGLGVRASNSISYFLPGNIGGFYGQVQYFMGENLKTGAVTEDDGRGLGARVGYAAGPFDVAVAVQRSEFAAGDVKTINIGGQWNFGVARLLAQYNRDRVPGQTDKSWLIGGVMPVGPGEIRASYSQLVSDVTGAEPKARKIALGYVHNLSKRTAAYTTVARVRNSGGQSISLAGSTTGANTSSTGFDLGIRHSF
jgi:predicted porin